MISLLWKDFRLNRSILLIGLLAVLAPYAALTVAVLRTQLHPGDVRDWSRVSELGFFFAAGLSLLAVALLGGNALASERPDRSWEFLAYLPPRRWEHLVSKAANAVGAIGGVALLNAALAVVVAKVTGNDMNEELTAPFLPSVASIASCIFGVAWLASSVSPGPAIPTVLSLVAPMIVAATIRGLAAEGADTDRLFMLTNHICGALAFVAGSVVYAFRRSG